MKTSPSSHTDDNCSGNKFATPQYWIKHIYAQAERVADIYLEFHPRKLLYGVKLTSSVDDSEETIFQSFSTEEMDILKSCSNIAEESGCTLEEILLEDGYQELVDYLVANDSPFPLDTLAAIDFDNPEKFTTFTFREVKDNGSLGTPLYIGVNLSDNEFKELLAEALVHSNKLSMNMLVYRKPEITQKIMKHLAYASMDNVCENTTPFVVDLWEIRKICEQILNPIKDILGLFNSPDEDIRIFVHGHQIVPEGKQETYCNSDNG